MKKLITAVFLFALSFTVKAQSDLELKFSGEQSSKYVQMDSVHISSLQNEFDTVLYYPDTSLVLEYITSNNEKVFNGAPALQLYQNYPNPFTNQTTFIVNLPVANSLRLEVYDITGRIRAQFTDELPAGEHKFLFQHGGAHNFYVLSATSGNEMVSMNMLSTLQQSNSTSKLIYSELREEKSINDNSYDWLKAKFNNNYFETGDSLLMVGFASPCGFFDFDTLVDAPETDTDYIFSFNNLVPVLSEGIIGFTEVCQGSKNIMYTTEGNFVVDYNWEYTGTNVELIGEGSNVISLDFMDNATSGKLIVVPSNYCGTGNMATLDITVNPLPSVIASATPLVIFDGEVSFLNAEGADEYLWNNDLGEGSSHEVAPKTTTTYNVTGTTTHGCTSTDSITITVKYNPVANNDTLYLDEDNSVIANILINDYDPDNDAVSLESFTEPVNGSVEKITNSLKYAPNPDYYGTDSIEYSISDGTGGKDGAKVYFIINPINDAPVATNDALTINEDGTNLVDVLLNDSDIDGDVLGITAFTQGTNGTVSQEGDALRYTPDANYNGDDSFTYDIGDGNGGVASATVNVTINPVNDLPVATNDVATVIKNLTVLVDVLVNDSDVDGDTLSITGFTQGTNGTVAQEGDSLRYTPDANYTGSDSFTYDIQDGNGGTTTATVTITVN